MQPAHPLRSLLSIIRVRRLLLVLFTYFLGVGLAHHLGIRLDFLNLLLGLLLCACLVEMQVFLSAYYDHPNSPWTQLHREDSEFVALKQVKLAQLLQTALLILTAGAVFTVILIIRRAFSPSALLLVGIAFLLCFFSAVPPIRFEKKGYEELAAAFLTANLIPSLGFILAGAEWHVLLVMLTLPLTLIYLAMEIALSIETFGHDLSLGTNRSISTRLGWKTAMLLHNLLILGAFLLVGVFFASGLTWQLTWPFLLCLPLGLFQILQIQQMAGGAKPHWKLLKWTAVGFYLLCTYLVTISLWIN